MAAELLERSSQLLELDNLWATVLTSGRGQLALVGGEAGSGKTSLVEAFCQSASRKTLVVTGVCDLLSTARPLGPFLDLAIELRSDTEAMDVGGRPDEVARSLLDALVGRGPTIVVIEDLHWADEATLDIVRILARRLGATPALIVATYRDDEIDRFHPLRILLGEIPDKLVRIRVPPFSNTVVGELARVAGLDGGELFSKTGGNPFFVTEVLRAGSDSIPDTVRDAVLARANRLGREAIELLDAVAVASPPTEIWLLEALVDRVEPSFSAALAVGILKTEGRTVGFRHELARLAILDTVSPGQRASLHRKAMTALADPPIGVPDVTRLAHHAEGAHDGVAMIRYGRLAAAQAAAVGANREAADLYGRVLRYRKDLEPLELADLFDKHAAHCFQADQGAAAIESASAAAEIYRAHDDIAAAVESLLRLATIQKTSGHAQEAEKSNTAALALVEAAPTGREQPKVFASIALEAMCAGASGPALAAGARAIELAEAIGDDETRIHSLVTIATVEMESPSTWERGRERMFQSIALAKEHGYHDLVGRGYNNLCYECQCTCRLDLMAVSVTEAVDYHSRSGGEVWLNCALASLSELQMAQGEWDAAVDSAHRVLQSPVSDGRRVGPLIVVGVIRARRGDPDPWSPLDEALWIAKQSGELQMVAPVGSARAEAAWLENDHATVATETDALIRAAIDADFEWAFDSMPYWRWLVGIKEPAASFDTTTPRRLQMTGKALEAAEKWQVLGYPYEAALALVDSGQESAMRDAHARLQSLGAKAAAAVVARRLRELGAKRIPRGPYRAAAGNPAGLTAREMEVLHLLVGGLSDAQVAEKLFLTEKTVGHHVSAILRKLEVSSRGQAAAEANRLGLRWSEI